MDKFSYFRGGVGEVESEIVRKVENKDSRSGSHSQKEVKEDEKEGKDRAAMQPVIDSFHMYDKRINDPTFSRIGDVVDRGVSPTKVNILNKFLSIKSTNTAPL